jgi:Fe-S cluster biogenesis protein NfuA
MADPAPAEEPGVQAPDRLDDPAVRALLAALNDQLDQLEAMPGPVSELGLTVVAGVAEIYGQALIRTLELADPAAVERMLDDELIAHLLALHGIHPESVEKRLTRVIDELRAAVSDQGGTVELDRLDETVAVVRVALGARASRSADVEHTVRRAVMTAVPELANVTIVPAGSASATAFVPLEALMRTATSARLP